MRRYRMIGLCLLIWLVAVPAFSQEVVLGFLEPPVVEGSRAPGVVRVFGWALADSGVKKVVIQVDGIDVGEAIYGQFRPLVQDMFPGFIDSAGAGFGYNLNGAEFLNGVYQVTVKVETFAGTTKILSAIDADGTIRGSGQQEILLNYNTTTLKPFGRIDRPQRHADLYGTCFDDGITPVRYSVISGWALDLGREIGDAGIGWAELLIDGVIVGNTRTECRFSLATGGLTDCYGLPRLDIERRYPFALNAPSAGFRFVLDVGFLLNIGFVQGNHTLTIRAGDISNQNANIDEIPVNFFCLENTPNQTSFGRIESPRLDRAYADLMTFQGWALDSEGVASVEVFVDGDFIGNAAFGAGLGTRPAVMAEFPGFPDTNAPVWRLRNFDTNNLADGFRQVEVFVTDIFGGRTSIGEVTFFVDNGVE